MLIELHILYIYTAILFTLFYNFISLSREQNAMQILITVYACHVWLFGVVYVVSHEHYLLSASDSDHIQRTLLFIISKYIA